MESPLRKNRRGGLKAIALLFFVFLLGNLTGVSGSTVFMLKRLQSNVRNPSIANGPAARFLDRMEATIADELNLTPREREGVHEEFQITRERLAGIRTRMVGEMRSLTRDTVVRVSRRIPEEKRRLFRERAAARLGPWGFAPEPNAE